MEKQQKGKGGMCRSPLDWIAFAAVMNYFVFRTLELTKFIIPFTYEYRAFTFASLVAAGTIRFVFLQYKSVQDHNECNGIEKSVFRGLAIAALSAPFFILAHRFGYHFLVYTPWVVICLYGFDGGKVLKTLSACFGILLVSSVFCSLTGAIDNILYSGKRGLRGCYGMGYPTDFASCFVFLLLFAWSLQKGHRIQVALFFFAAALVLAYVAYYYVASDTSTIISLMIAAVVLFEGMDHRFFSGHKGTKWIGKTTDGLAVCAFPVLGAVYWGLTWLYGHGNSLAVRINTWMSGRLNLSWLSLQKYGIHAFGALTPQNGWGGGDFHDFHPDAYEFLDSTYALLVIRYGWVLTLIVTALWVWMTWKMLKTGRRRWALAMALIAVHSFSEHHFIEINYNIILALPLCSFPLLKEESAKKDGGRSRALYAAGFLLLALFVLCIPRIIAFARALFSACGWSGGISLLPLLICIGCFLLAFVLWICLKKGVHSLELHRKIPLRVIVIAVAALCIAGIGIVWANQKIDRHTEALKPRIAADQSAVEIIMAAASEPVYAGDAIEEAYARHFSGFTKRTGSPEEISREMRGTIILDREYEAVKLIGKGAVYAEISEFSGVYTFDDLVIRALRDEGYMVHGYYSSSRNVSLAQMAAVSGAELSDDATVPLGGEHSHLVYGPYMNQYGGRYQVTFDLSADSQTLQENEVVATVKVTGKAGQEVYGSQDIYSRDFDESGHLSFSFTYSVGDAMNVEYPVFVRDEAQIIVNGISWRRFPAVDTWRKYSADGLPTKEQYFTPDGKPLMQSRGYYGVAYEYDHRYRMATLIQYLDEDDNLMMLPEGYAQIARSYNDRRLVEEERYMDTEGKLCLSAQKYAMNRREYDNNRNLTLQSFYDTEGKPTLNSSGYASVRLFYDGKNRVVRQEFFGTDGEPTALSAGQYAEEYEYDDSDNQIMTRYLGADGKPVMVSGGYAEIRREYDAKKQKTRESYYDAEGKACMLSGGYAAYEQGFDETGNVNDLKYYDTENRPVLISSGYAEICRVFNSDRRVIKESYYDTEGWQMELPKGQAAVEYDYNSAGNQVLVRYLGFEDQPVMLTDGYAEIHRVYSDSGKLLEESYYDTEGEPANIYGAYAKFRNDYDERNELLLTYFTDKENRPVQCGSSYFHEYLQSLKGRNITIFIAVRDEATNSLTGVLLEDLRELGIRSDVKNLFHYSYYAIITPDEVIEDMSDTETISRSGQIGEISYSITSGGYFVGNTSSIIINEEEYSKNSRGMNFVILDNETNMVIETVGFDTFAQQMWVSR